MSRSSFNLTAITSLFLIFSLTACNQTDSDDKSDQEKKPYKVPVETTQLAIQNIDNTYRTTAVLEAKSESKVTNKVTGMILDILVEEGMTVEKNQLLANIDAEGYQLDYERASIDLNSAIAEYNRSKPIKGKQLISAKDLEKLEFLVQLRTNQQKIAAIKVRDAHVRAPIAGVIAAKNVKVGNMTPNAGSEMFHIVALNTLQGVVYLPESEINHVYVGQQAQLVFPTKVRQLVNASVALISPIVDTESGTFKVTLNVNNDDKSLKPGMFAKVSLVLDSHENVQVVPQKVLLVTDTETSLFVVENNKAKKIVVETGFEQDGLVEITTPLNENEEIILVGQLGLKADSLVMVVNKADNGKSSSDATDDLINESPANKQAENEQTTIK